MKERAKELALFLSVGATLLSVWIYGSGDVANATYFLVFAVLLRGLAYGIAENRR